MERKESNERPIEGAYLPIPGAGQGFGEEWHFGDHLFICKLLEEYLGRYFHSLSFKIGPDGEVLARPRNSGSDADPLNVRRHQVILILRAMLRDVLRLDVPPVSIYVSELPQELIQKEIEAMGGYWRKKIMGILPNIRADAWNTALDAQAFVVAKQKLDDEDWRLMIEWYKENWEKKEGGLTIRGQIELYRLFRYRAILRKEDHSPERIQRMLKLYIDILKKKKEEDGGA